MNFYERELGRIRQLVYANQSQLDTVVSLRRYIDLHYADDLSLDLLARDCFVSKYHLLRLFKRYYGQTPKQYLTDKRIEKSKEWLRLGSSVSHSCFAVGFDDPASFATLFRSRTGQTPSAFRKKQFSQGATGKDAASLRNKHLDHENKDHQPPRPGPGTGPGLLYGEIGLYQKDRPAAGT